MSLFVHALHITRNELCYGGLQKVAAKAAGIKREVEAIQGSPLARDVQVDIGTLVVDHLDK